MTGLAIVLAAAVVGLGLAEVLRLPSIPVLIVAGVVTGLLGVFPDSGQLQDFLLLGLTFLVFEAGTELNPARIGDQKMAAVRVGLSQFVLIGAIGLGCAAAVGLDRLQGLYIGLAVAASSTLIVVRLLQQRQQFYEPFGRLVLGVLLIQDVLVIFFISVLTHSGEGVFQMGVALAATIGLVGLAWLFMRHITPYLLLKLSMDEETLLLCVLAILFMFVGLSHLSGLALVVGAFLGGVSLSNFPVNGLIKGQLLSLASFFRSLFFVTLGATLQLPGGFDLLLAALLIALVVLLTPPLVTLISEREGLSARAGIEGGLLLSQTSEFSIVVALVGLEQGHIREGLLAVIALVTVVTMILTPLLATHRMTWKLMKLHPSRRSSLTQEAPSDHMLLIGCGESGRALLDGLSSLPLTLLVLDDDPVVVSQIKQLGVSAMRGNGADYVVLKAAGAPTARAILSTMTRLKDNESVLKFARGTRVIVRVFDESEAERIRQRGGVPVMYSHAAVEEFMRWFDHEFDAVTRERRPLTSVPPLPAPSPVLE